MIYLVEMIKKLGVKMKEQFTRKFNRRCGFGANFDSMQNISRIERTLRKKYINELREATLVYIELTDIEKENLLARVFEKHSKRNNDKIDSHHMQWVSLYYSGYWVIEDKRID
tara:strand:- start:189 stop:527 length:339 start_codon:yes stop_codon:yes gene_type:complete